MKHYKVINKIDKTTTRIIKYIYDIGHLWFGQCKLWTFILLDSTVNYTSPSAWLLSTKSLNTHLYWVHISNEQNLQLTSDNRRDIEKGMVNL